MKYEASYIMADSQGNIDTGEDIHLNDSLEMLLLTVRKYAQLHPRSFYKVIIKSDGVEIARYSKFEICKVPVLSRRRASNLRV